jgi:hypothetical protein
VDLLIYKLNYINTKKEDSLLFPFFPSFFNVLPALGVETNEPAQLQAEAGD